MHHHFGRLASRARDLLGLRLSRACQGRSPRWLSRVLGRRNVRPGHGERQRAIIFPARALDNTSYVLLANHSGPSGPFHGCGGSAVWNPDGTLLTDAATAQPGLAVAGLLPGVLARARAEEPVLVDPSLSAPVRSRSGVRL
ncbi:nitrilase-related carbon-nitrogen hydrolase [Streptomyces sp. NPDC056308]|uniref:nitrilase-related carbon-nitrogen hydrolase n=1 Tax=Streptomyces sp. NPDC056308 TaxID=3345780 RepID=UPI0035DC7F0E